MTNIVYEKNGEFVSKIEARGHSGYGKKGCDVVCAGISVLFRTFIIFLKRESGIVFEKSDDDGNLIIKIIKIESDKIELYNNAVEFLFLGLESLNIEFPDYLSIKKIV